jgi:hypothetical protein
MKVLSAFGTAGDKGGGRRVLGFTENMSAKGSMDVAFGGLGAMEL